MKITIKETMTILRKAAAAYVAVVPDNASLDSYRWEFSNLEDVAAEDPEYLWQEILYLPQHEGLRFWYEDNQTVTVRDGSLWLQTVDGRMVCVKILVQADINKLL